MAKSREAFRTISEVAEWLDTPAHVLRFWESKFSQIKPVKRAGGRRYYRPTDMALIGGIKQLLHVEGMTIKGVQKVLREQGVKHVASLSQPLDDALDQSEEAAPAPTAKPSEPEPRVVPFQARTAAPDETAAELDVVAPPEEPMAAEAPAPEPEEAPDAIPEDTPEPEPDIPIVETAPPEPAPASEPPGEDAPTESEDEPTLPGFLRAAAEKPSEPVAEENVPTPPEPEPEPVAPAPKMVSVPDDPEDAAVLADPGVLSAALRLKDMDGPQAEAAAEAIAQLRGLRDRMAAQR